MKKLLIVAACMMVALSAYAQGTVILGNRVTGVIDAPVFDVGGTTRLVGPNAFAQLYAGPSATTLAAVGDPVAFRTGAGAGYFPNTSETIATVAPGVNAFIQVVAWKDAATYAAASIKGASDVFTVLTGNAGAPPSLPSNLVGLTSFSLVPEPSTIALGLLGAAFLVLRRRN